MNDTYRTFIRAANNWEEFAHALKTEVDTGLTLEEARQNCAEFNSNRSAEEVTSGTKLEFESE